MCKVMDHSFRYLLLALALVMLSSFASAQMADRAELNNISKTSGMSVKPAANPFSLLDFSRISWSNSYSVGFFSGGGSSGSVGLLNSTMFYEVSSKLSLSLNLGIAHSGGLGSVGQQATILPGFSLDFHPSEKFRMTLMIQRFDAAFNPFVSRSGSWYSPIGPR